MNSVRQPPSFLDCVTSSTIRRERRHEAFKTFDSSIDPPCLFLKAQRALHSIIRISTTLAEMPRSSGLMAVSAAIVDDKVTRLKCHPGGPLSAEFKSLVRRSSVITFLLHAFMP